jgi:hypothetical protein
MLLAPAAAHFGPPRQIAASSEFLVEQQRLDHRFAVFFGFDAWAMFTLEPCEAVKGKTGN